MRTNNLYGMNQQILSIFLGRSRVTARGLLRWATLIVLACAATLLGTSQASSAEPEILARVDGEPVTRGELRRMLADTIMQRQLQQELGIQEPELQELQRLALQKLITQHVILQEAGRLELAATEQEVERAIAVIRRRLRKPSRFTAYLNARGLDEKSLRDAVRTDMLMTRVRETVLAGVVISEEQVGEYYAAHRDDLKTPEEVRLRTFTLKDKAAAEQTLAALKKGEDFKHRDWDRSLESRAAHGDNMGWVEPRALPPFLQEAVATLKPGGTGGPVQTDEGFLVVRLEERQPARTMSLAEARPTIEIRLLFAKRKEAFQTWLSEREKHSKIEVFFQPELRTTGIAHDREQMRSAGEGEFHHSD